MNDKKLRNLTIVIVGFRVDTENSIVYMKKYMPNDHDLGTAINKAFHDKQCDFISLRAIDKEVVKQK